jgi:flagellar capping protein FliD
MQMNNELEMLSTRLSKLESDYAELLRGDRETKQRYSALKTMVRELTDNTVRASDKAAASAQKALLAGHLASDAAKEAAILGAIRVAELALDAAKTSADAAADAAVAASEAWTVALIAAGHSAESDLLKMSTKASEASKAATIAAAKALEVFSDAFVIVKQAATRKPLA